MANTKKEFFFTYELIRWDKNQNFRIMPWKGEKDPYKIWLSEIILQQTRVEQGRAYYEKFIQKYPTVKKLAAAPDTEIFKMWEGLGYYSRCRNLIATAKFIAIELEGKFPSAYESILQLKGVGPYTAAAISSFAFELPYAVVDGNVVRVLSRYFGIHTAADTTEGKKLFFESANRLLDRNMPGLYNQAIMDFGATICKPQQPLCLQCVLSEKCVAYLQNAVNDYPVKSKKLVKKNRWFYYILAEEKGAFLVRQREAKDIWQNLYEFYLIEADKQLSPAEVMALPAFKEATGGLAEIVHISPGYKQQLTHQTIHGNFIEVRSKDAGTVTGYQRVKKVSLLKLAFPRFITGYFADRKGFSGAKL